MNGNWSGARRLRKRTGPAIVRALTALAAAVRAEAAELEQRLAQRIDAEHAYEDARVDVRELTFLAKLARDLDDLAASLDP